MTAATDQATHVPVMTSEVMAALAVRPGGRYVDCTVGGGGHAEAIVESASPGGTLLGIDLDPDALDAARERLAPFGEAVRLVEGNFRQVGEICRDLDFVPVHGILFDLGMSTLQVEEARRGFSFQREAPLDMRFDSRQSLTAAEIVNEYPEEDLVDILRRYGEDPRSRRIARVIAEVRPLSTTTQLAKAIEQAVGRRAGTKSHPATRTFQALRIAVNQELENLAAALPQAHGLLGFGARIAVISYHSLEDRIVKTFLQREFKNCLCPPRTPVCTCGHRATLRPVTRGAVRPAHEEITSNPRARSARLRAAERMQTAVG
jgi:16S rRNA (cytosine1402-N4)-methyltransferase